MARLTILHTNDLHGALTPAKAARIRELKEANAPCLYFDSGDCIKAGNLAIPLKQEQAWDLLAQAGCDASTLGNRESHPLESAFRAKLAGARHPILVANMRQKGTKGRGGEETHVLAPTHSLTDSLSPHPPIPSPHHPFPGSIQFEIAGLSVGVIGVMVPMVTERMKTAFASAYLWDSPIEAVQEEINAHFTGSLAYGEDSCTVERNPPPPYPLPLSHCDRGSSPDLLIALTHIGIAQDRRLAGACPELDLILGGHSHTVLEKPERVGKTWICQGGSHGRFVGRYVWDAEVGLKEAELLPL